ncbi:HET-domain-containing protein [Alternaria alternata]|nr:HET-domain-containing protein [Alternaria alternata]
MLCGVCSHMFSSKLRRGDHHISFESFTKAGAEGCYICTPLLKFVRKKQESLEDYYDDYYPCKWTICSSLNHFDKLAYLDIGMTGNRHPYSRIFYITPDTVLPVGTAICSRSSAIPFTHSVQVAQMWMRSCLNKHEQCHKHAQPQTYPTRLLELGLDNSRLILTRENEPSGPYAALSYCWGPNPSFTCLTAENLQDFRLQLPYSNLPVAFQEAVRLVQGLGIRYLWIDALCIIQSGLGSREDWQSECGRMQEVYSNCIVNLSLAQASHPDQSCLGGYTWDSTPPFEVDIAHKAPESWERMFGTEIQEFGPRETHKYTVISEDYFREALYKQPIGSRAWVMQERLLPTRVLSIGHGELFWDCEQVPHASESLPFGLSLCADLQKGYLNQGMGLSIPSIPRTSDSEELVEIWSKILMEYTARELTFPKDDKLMALSAIASRMGDVMNDTYLAGHFRKSLPQSLNWKVYCEVTPVLRTEMGVTQRLLMASNQSPGEGWILTPSWSWASVNGRLDTQATHEPIRKFYNPEAAVMRVTRGRKMATFLASLVAERLSPIIHNNPARGTENEILLTIKTWGGKIKWKNARMNHRLAIVSIDKQELYFEMDDMDVLPADGSECLLAALCCRDDLVEGLLLRATSSNCDIVYERLGHFTWHYKNAAGRGDWKVLFTSGDGLITLR